MKEHNICLFSWYKSNDDGLIFSSGETMTHTLDEGDDYSLHKWGTDHHRQEKNPQK